MYTTFQRIIPYFFIYYQLMQGHMLAQTHIMQSRIQNLVEVTNVCKISQRYKIRNTKTDVFHIRLFVYEHFHTN